MHKRKTFFILVLTALFVISCSLPNGATMSAATLATPGASPTAERIDAIPSPSPPEYCTVTADFLNLRACAGTDCLVLDVLKKGDPLTILERGDWLKIEGEKDEVTLTGYINSIYCKMGE